ncbi:MAG: mandelate racemase [Deltaproteobacteria bacterium]|nr:mandelate racemase [Deltaproteobacteria bacterium]
MSTIDRVEVHEFTYEVNNLCVTSQAIGVANIVYGKGNKLPMSRYVVVIQTDEGLRGEYVTHWVGTMASLAQTLMLAPQLIGRDPEMREEIYDDLKRELRHYDHMGHGPIDIALWDLAGKKLGSSVSSLLGGFRRRLKVYASSYHAQEEGGGLDSIEAFSDFAEHCKGLGFEGFKIHGWHNGDARREAKNVLRLRERIGDEMYLMIDPACQLRTFSDALYVGRACDDAGYFWYEDPYRDSAVSAFSHRRLREMIKTPLLVTEHVRGLEQKANFVLAGGCDMIHADPEFDMGITGCMKIAHFAEALGIDLQIHAAGPAQRACMSAIRNTHLYELALVGPGMPNAVPPVYACDYSDQLEDIGEDGCFPVPQGPGLGVRYDWDFIVRHRTQEHVFV